MVVVVGSPGLGQLSRGTQVLEQFAVQELVTELRVEAFGESVLPRAAGRDVENFNPQACEPTPNRLRDELRSVVAPDALRDAAMLEQLRQDVDHVLTRQTAIDLQSQALASVLIDQAQPLERGPVLGPVEHKVPRPHIVHVL